MEATITDFVDKMKVVTNENAQLKSDRDKITEKDKIIEELNALIKNQQENLENLEQEKQMEKREYEKKLEIEKNNVKLSRDELESNKTL